MVPWICRVVLTAGLLVAGVPGLQDAARAQTELPEIVIRSPSPIVHRAPARPAAGGQAQPSAPAGLATESPPGTLPIVTDQFATVTAVPSDEIRRSGAATLGDLLFLKPGITG